MDENEMKVNEIPAEKDTPAENIPVQDTENTYSQEVLPTNVQPVPQYNYQQPVDTEPPVSGGNIGFSITSLVCGILSILCCCAWYLSIILAVVAIVFGILSLKKNADGRTMAIAGLITGGLGLVLSIIVLVLVLVGSAVGDSSIIYQDFIESLDL
ncbi:MAG: DUF4190 domain-containing protein [Lachnospiraceae bacterium]